MDMTQQEIKNMITMIGCNEQQFMDMIQGYDRISMSSGSWYADFYIFAGTKLLAVYDWKGNLKQL